MYVFVCILTLAARETGELFVDLGTWHGQLSLPGQVQRSLSPGSPANWLLGPCLALCTLNPSACGIPHRLSNEAHIHWSERQNLPVSPVSLQPLFAPLHCWVASILSLRCSKCSHFLSTLRSFSSAIFHKCCLFPLPGMYWNWMILTHPSGLRSSLKVKAAQAFPTRQYLNRFVAVYPRLCIPWKFTHYPAYFYVIPTASVCQFGAQRQDVWFHLCIAVLSKALGKQQAGRIARGSLLFQSEGKEGRT